MTNILAVLSSPHDIDSVRRSLAQECTLVFASSLAEAGTQIGKQNPDLVLWDSETADASGIHELRKRVDARTLPVLLLSPCLVSKQTGSEDVHCIIKPCHEETIRTVVRLVLDGKNTTDGLCDASNRLRDAHRELTQRSHSHQRLQSETFSFNTLFDAIPLGTLVLNNAGTITLANSAATRLLKRPLTTQSIDQSNQTVRWLLADQKTPVPESLCPFRRVLAGEQVDGFTVFIPRPYGGVCVRCTARPVIDRSGEQAGAFVFLHKASSSSKMATSFGSTTTCE